MPYTHEDKQVLRELANTYMEFATLSVQKEKIELWKSLNSLQMQRPMVFIDQLPIFELTTDDDLKLKVTDPFWRSVEWDLRMKIYRWKHFPVDMVFEPYITIPEIVYCSGYGIAPEVHLVKLTENTTAASQKFNPIIKDYEDIEKIKDITYVTHKDQDELHLNEAKEIFDGCAPVVMRSLVHYHLGVWDFLTQYMSVENIYYDLYDRPEFLHACMDRITNATIAGIEKANELMLHDDNMNLCHCSHIYTEDLLSDVLEGMGRVSKNCWAFGLAQLFSSVSPSLFEEFEIPYIKRMTEYFGYIYYGCCDRLDDRLECIKTIPNVRKISCSPWSDRRNFAERIGKKHIMSFKPSPALLATDSFDEELVRKDIKQTIDLAKSNNINLEIILKDISTVRNEPERLSRWADVVMNLVCSYT